MRAHQLRAEGLSISAIAQEMGIGRTTVSDYIHHPETGKLYRSRARQYQICTCGRKMSYGAGTCNRCRRS